MPSHDVPSSPSGDRRDRRPLGARGACRLAGGALLALAVSASSIVGTAAMASAAVDAPAKKHAATAHSAKKHSAAKHSQKEHRASKHAGKVVVLSAGSLETIMKTAVEPGFRKATGYTVTDVSGGSTGLAQDIKSGVHQADVFWSAAATSDERLMGKKNGDWVRWYLTFATTSLVLGYERTDKFAPTLESKPWWKVVTEPGFLVGRTNPVTDPKGRLTVDALKKAAAQHHDPALGAIARNQTSVFTETSLVGRLQSGQLNAGFFYAVEASAAHFPTSALTGATEKAAYTLAIVAKAPHPGAADAFVSWMLSPRAKRLLRAHGLVELGRPRLSGERAAVPKPLRRAVSR